MFYELARVLRYLSANNSAAARLDTLKKPVRSSTQNAGLRSYRSRIVPTLMVFSALAVTIAFAQTARPQGSVTRGGKVFDDNCAQCHYPDSKDEKVGPGLQGVRDGKLPDGRAATHDRILDIVNTGPAEMTSFKDRLSEQEKEDVVAYVMTL
jgi:cytochrome c6